MLRQLVTLLVVAAVSWGSCQAQQKKNDIPSLVAACKPAIVAIAAATTTKLPEEVAEPISIGSANGQPVYLYFVGSGFVVSKDGFVVTAAHVIEHLKEPISVFANDGKLHDAKIVAQSPGSEHDYAVLKIDDKNLTFVPLDFGKFDSLQEGDEVLLMGYPFGQGYVSSYKGIIAAIPKSPSNKGMQLDLVVNSGSSGAPVIDVASGKVVAVANAKMGKLSPYLKQIKDAQFRWGIQMGGGDFDLQKFVRDIVNVMDEHIQMGVGIAISSEYAEQALQKQHAAKP